MPGCWGNAVYHVLNALARLAAKLMFGFHTEHAERVPRQGSLLVACNHVSHLDPPLTSVGIPRLVIHMAKRELFRLPWLLAIMKAIGTIMVDRGHGQKALDEAVDVLGQGACVVIYPEGTRSTTGVLQKGRSGAIVIAIHSGCPILPVAMVGSEQAMTKGTKRIRRVPVRLVVGEPYTIAYDGDPHNIPREVLRGECFKLMERIEELLPQHMRPAPEQKRIWYGELFKPTGQNSDVS